MYFRNRTIRYARVFWGMCVLLFVLNASCTVTDRAAIKKPGEQVLLFGVDGLEWRILYPLVRMGKMPVLERLMKGGSFGVMFSPTMQSPSEWTSIVTGKKPEKHGIPGFGEITLDQKPGQNKATKIIHITRKDRKVKTIWNILSEHNFRTGSVGFWATWPAETVNGALITDAFIYRAKLEHTFFPADHNGLFDKWSKEGERAFRDWKESYLRQEGLEDTWQDPRDIRYVTGQFEHFLEHMQFDFIKFCLARGIYHEFRPDFLAVYLRSPDLSSHFFYKDVFDNEGKAAFPETVKDRQNYNTLIPLIYQDMDNFLALLLGLYEQEPTVIYLSDHGFGPTNYIKNFNVSHFIQKTSLQINDRSLNELVTLGNCPSDENSERTCLTLQQGCCSEEEQDKMLGQIERALKNIVTLDGKPLFSDVTLIARRKDYGLMPEGTEHPTIILTANENLELTDSLTEDGQVLYLHHYFSFNRWSGSHRRYAALVLNGPHIKKNFHLSGNLSTWDITPTILRLFQLPQARDLDGTSIEEALTVEFTETHPHIAPIDTYDRGLDNSSLPDMDPETNTKIIEELKSIGYL